LQKALEAGKLDKPLADRVLLLLDERARQYLRNCTPHVGGPRYDADWMTREATDWPEQDRQLFALAAEVAEKIQE
jgi:hypothetical protein